MKRIRVIVFIIVLVLAAIACNGSSKSTPEKIDPVEATVSAGIKQTQLSESASAQPQDPVTEPTATVIVPQRYAVGDIVKVGDIQIVINEVKEISGTDFFMPNEGNRFIIIDVTMENLGTEDHAASSLMEYTLKDDTGQEYSESVSAEVASGGKSPGGTILPGDKLRGQIGYEIPISATGFVLTYTNGFFNSVSAQFNLGF